MSLVRGIRCTKCGKELSHVVSDDDELEATASGRERVEGDKHRRWCGGTIVRFTQETRMTELS